MIRKAYKYRIYPNQEQREYFARVFGCVRFFYNKSLSDMCDLYKETGRSKNITPATYKKEYPSIKSRLYKEAFWSQSFCLISTGGANIETIKKYIESQGE